METRETDDDRERYKGVCLRLQPAHHDVGGVPCTEERDQSDGEMEENGERCSH